jgi:putative heme iron utilization protein
MAKRQHAGSGGAATNVPEPSLAERARTLISIGRIGALATHSKEWPGYPFASMMPYAADGQGRPAVFVSSMAMHTQNLVSDMRASLLVVQPDVSGDPLAAARVTLVGTMVETPAEEVRDLYVGRHENSRYWQDFADFAYYRQEVAAAYYIGGFGVMGWISGEEYAAAAPDPLADAAPGIIAHMNADHADALLRIARHYTGETGDEASIISVDRLGFHVRLKSADGFHGVRVGFPREARSSEEARKVFVEMARVSASPS